MPGAGLKPVSLADIEATADRIRGIPLRTPLLRLDGATSPDIHLKLENLQPVGSFKIRGAANSVATLDAGRLADGIGTASAGNMGRAVAWLAHRHGIPCTVVVPDGAPAAKLEPMRALGAWIVEEPFERWWRALVDNGHPAVGGTFLSAFASQPMIAGNATIGLELVADLPELEAVVVPYGGGGLSSGIACAVRALRPDVPVYAAEVEGAAPFAAALAAGRPVDVELRRSFVDGIGSGRVVDAMWPLASEVLAGSIVVTLDEVRAALRLLAAGARVVAEGAGAVALAAALTGRAGSGRVAVVISGGNIDPPMLAEIVRPAP
ncbi:MAG TPA: pyridoxal-phosphate dependent enzyme [Candidatus Limnocylindria bacterium]|jgi:threonine dehydratase|nr:pyridoxal-phosphate dependent enzyme [Candidatus Limnocylindria bacterium]